MILIARYIHQRELVVSLFSVVTGEDEKNPCQILCYHINVFSFTAWISLAHHEIYTGYELK